MREMFSGNALWAMHPDVLSAVLAEGAMASLVPESLRGLAALAPTQARAPADPIREGGTIILPVAGVLSPRGTFGSGGTSTEKLADRVREAAADPKIGAIVLHVTSPGGLVYGNQEAGDAIYEARQSKPIIAVASPMAFSAAHWLATQASAFYASPSAEVGSVGVRGGHVDKSGFEEKIGMRTTLIASDPEKIAGHSHGPLSDADRAQLQASVDEANQAFVAAIARGRGIAPGDVPGIHGAGRTFSSKAAAVAGVTDGIMTLRDVVAKYGTSRARLGLMRQRAAVRGAAAAI
jgi:signal peptide peptidase SppA